MNKMLKREPTFKFCRCGVKLFEGFMCSKCQRIEAVLVRREIERTKRTPPDIVEAIERLA